MLSEATTNCLSIINEHFNKLLNNKNQAKKMRLPEHIYIEKQPAYADCCFTSLYTLKYLLLIVLTLYILFILMLRFSYRC